MLILLPSDVQGRGNALIISSRVPLKEKPSGGFGQAGGGLGLKGGWLGCRGGRVVAVGETAQYSIRIGPRCCRMSVLNSIELN